MRDTSGPVGSGSSREDLSQVYKLSRYYVVELYFAMVYVRGRLFFVSSEFAIVDFIKRILDIEQVL